VEASGLVGKEEGGGGGWHFNFNENEKDEGLLQSKAVEVVY
jgi:hypothetical protein